MTAYWGYHLILDCKGGDLDQIQSKENIKLFVEELVAEIDMVAYGDPVIEHFATHQPDKAGYSSTANRNFLDHRTLHRSKW